MIELHHGDCLEVMKQGPDKSIDMILCDLPYGTTGCKWDVIIPFDKLWEQYERLIKDNGAIVLFGGQPFTSTLIVSNLKLYRYNWIWNKRKAANFLFGNKQPLKITEDICVFYKKQPVYNPQKRLNPAGPQKGYVKKSMGRTIYDHGTLNLPEGMVSHPGKNRELDKLLPTTILEFSKPSTPIHPTQKPIELLEYLVKTYTNGDGVVLDNTMGSGSTGVACVNTGRSFVGIEKEEKYFKIAQERIDCAVKGYTSGV